MKALLMKLRGFGHPIDSVLACGGKFRRIPARWRVVGLTGCSFLLFLLASVSVSAVERPGSFTGGPPLELEVFSPCPGYADLYPDNNNDGGFTGSTPDFSAIKLYPTTVNGVSTWNILVLGQLGTACRPSVRFTLTTPSDQPDGDYCAAGGCGEGQATVFIP